ncbi:MAG TPA: GAF domain-containing protein, partial [Elainellaceae cyanobacterium]
EYPAYMQLTWALFGAASPHELIADSRRTPFNIGTAIALPGFTLEEAKPLLQGLAGVVETPQMVLAAILQWTEGQPFLTQKICRLVQQSDRQLKDSPIDIPPGAEASWIEDLIRSHVIQHWEVQDEPEHLRTIRNLLIHNSAQAGRLLGIYQQILCSNRGLSLDLTGEADEWMPLTLSGLVVRSGDRLIVRNRIYSEIFNLDWVKRQLANLRPYSDALETWVYSGYQDESQLLQEQDLYDAQAWTVGKSLSDLDYQFLAASQLCDRHRRERRIVEILSVLSYRSGELKPYLRQIALAVSELLNLDWSVVTLCHEDDERILASSIDIGPASDQVYSLHGALTGYVVHTGNPLFVDDAVVCKDYGNPPDGYLAYLGVPLRISTGEIIGTICSFHEHVRHFDCNDVKLVSIFADRAAMAIENYQIYQQLQELNKELESKLNQFM